MKGDAYLIVYPSRFGLFDLSSAYIHKEYTIYPIQFDLNYMNTSSTVNGRPMRHIDSYGILIVLDLSL